VLNWEKKAASVLRFFPFISLPATSFHTQACYLQTDTKIAIYFYQVFGQNKVNTKAPKSTWFNQIFKKIQVSPNI
jgi:hypothetical protein